MSGLGGLNKSPHGVVLGLVQLQLPVVHSPDDLARQTAQICAMVARARRNMPGMDLVVFPEYALRLRVPTSRPRPRSHRDAAMPEESRSIGIAGGYRHAA